MNTLIKLCGFKHIDDISYAASLDINYLGMIFVEKGSNLSVLSVVSMIFSIISSISSSVKIVGLSNPFWKS